MQVYVLSLISALFILMCNSAVILSMAHRKGKQSLNLFGTIA